MTIFDRFPVSPFADSYDAFGLPVLAEPAPANQLAAPLFAPASPRTTLTRRASSYPLHASDLAAAAGQGVSGVDFSLQSDDAPVDEDFGSVGHSTEFGWVDAMVPPSLSEQFGKTAAFGLLGAIVPGAGLIGRGLDINSLQGLLAKQANIIGKPEPSFWDAALHSMGKSFFSPEDNALAAQFSGLDEHHQEGTPTGLGIGNLGPLSIEEIEGLIEGAKAEVEAEAAAAAAAAATQAAGTVGGGTGPEGEEGTGIGGGGAGGGDDTGPGDESDEGGVGGGGAGGGDDTGWHAGGLLPGAGDREITAEGGEFVIQKDAVDNYGRGLFAALNSGLIPAKNLRGLFSA